MQSGTFFRNNQLNTFQGMSNLYQWTRDVQITLTTVLLKPPSAFTINE